jgi:hypothetical protein
MSPEFVRTPVSIRRQRVMELTAQGLSLRAIADELGISPALVGKDRHRSPKLDGANGQPTRRAVAHALRALQLPRAGVAAALGISVRTLTRWSSAPAPVETPAPDVLPDEGPAHE